MPAPPGYKVLVTGDATLSRDLTTLSGSDLQKGEAIGIPIALVILVFVFGALVAALVPVAARRRSRSSWGSPSSR